MVLLPEKAMILYKLDSVQVLAHHRTRGIPTEHSSPLSSSIRIILERETGAQLAVLKPRPASQRERDRQRAGERERERDIGREMERERGKEGGRAGERERAAGQEAVRQRK